MIQKQSAQGQQDFASDRLDPTALERAAGLYRTLQRLFESRPALRQEVAASAHEPLTPAGMAAWLDREPLTEDAVKPRLRRLRQRVFAHVAVRDLAGLASLAEVTETMSALAELAVTRSIDVLLPALQERHGQPGGQRAGEQNLIVLGMGKLGGRELNVSSDIDLIFVYPEEGESAGPVRTSNFEFYTRLGRRLIDALADMTGAGRLHLDGINDLVLTSPIDNTLTEKTLVAWVSLDNLDQPGGGSAISVQISNGGGGNGFDGIVYAERMPYQWMAGSDFWRRSVPDNFGEEESVTEPGEVMMAISYAADYSITIYRDRQIYADPADTSQGTLNTYQGGVAGVIFGRRDDGAGNPLSGWINEARIYNTALDLPAIQGIFTAGADLTPSDPPPAPALQHQWTFNGAGRDQVGSAHGILSGGATLVGDRLSVDGGAASRMLTESIGESLTAKTLVCRVRPS